MRVLCALTRQVTIGVGSDGGILINRTLRICGILNRHPTFQQISYIQYDGQYDFHFLLSTRQNRPGEHLSRELFLLRHFKRPGRVLAQYHQFSILIYLPVFRLLNGRLGTIVLTRNLLHCLLNGTYYHYSIPGLRGNISTTYMRGVLATIMVFQYDLLRGFLTHRVTSSVQAYHIVP